MDYYDQISKGYPELHREEQLAKIRLIRQNMNMMPGDILLDLGCGPGFGDFGCRSVGLDSSIGLLRQAKIPSVLGKAEDLPFRDSSFDTVVSVTAVQNFDDIEKALLEARRVGKNSFAFSFLKRSPKAPMIERLIQKHFRVEKRIDEEKDIILIGNLTSKQ